MIINKRIFPYLLILPALICIILVVVYPLYYLLGSSFYDFVLIRQAEKTFVGLGNYWKLVSNWDFWYSFFITLEYVVSSTVITFLLGLGIALILHRNLPLTRLFRSIYLLPMVATPVIVALTWRHMWNFRFGIINFLLGKLGIPPLMWLAKPGLALIAIIITDVWQWTPFVIIVLGAGLASVPVDLYDAARVDGCSAWQELWHVTLPSIRAVVGLSLVIRIMDIFRNADLVYVITAGGPGIATEVLAYSVFKKAFVSFQIGQAAALAFVLVFISTVVVSNLLKQFEVRV